MAIQRQIEIDFLSDTRRKQESTVASCHRPRRSFVTWYFFGDQERHSNSFRRNVISSQLPIHTLFSSLSSGEELSKLRGSVVGEIIVIHIKKLERNVCSQGLPSLSSPVVEIAALRPQLL
jgi:hypothetical protein